MKTKFLLPVLSALLLAGCASAPERAPAKLATFGCHIQEAAKQRGVTVAEIAKLVKSWGYDGVDLWVGKDENCAEAFLAAGLEPAAVIVFAQLAQNPGTESAASAIAYAKRVGCKRIMLVPGFLDKGEKRAVVWPTVMRNLASFVKTCNDAGLDVVLEDFSNDKILIGSVAHLRKAFAEIPNLGLVLDTGNFAYWGDDPVAATQEFLPRIRHVHLNDRDPKDSNKLVVLGTGSLPLGQLCGLVRTSGYDGWYSVESFGASDMSATLRDSASWFTREFSALSRGQVTP